MHHSSVRMLRVVALAIALLFGVAHFASVNAQETVVPTSSGLPTLEQTVVTSTDAPTTSAASTTDAATTSASTTSASTTEASTAAAPVVVKKAKKDNTGRWGLLGLLGLAGLTGLLRRGSTVPIEPPVTRTTVEPVVTRTTTDRTDTDTRR